MVTNPTFAESTAASETLEYRWRLGGFKGAIARVFIPGSGKGTLTTAEDGSGNIVSELHISSPDARQGDFWLYGSEIDPRERQTVRAWTLQSFRGERKEKESELDGKSVVNLASSIYFLRRELPKEETRAKIWSRGRLYEVAIRPTGLGARVVGGHTVRTRGYALRGVGSPRWDGRLDLVLEDDDQAIPLEILIARDGLKVRLDLVDGRP